MAAGDNLAITNSLIASFGTAKEVAKTAADQDNAGVAQKFIYTPTGKPQKVIFLVHVGDATGLTITVSAGDNVFGAAAKTIVTATKVADYAIQVETGAFAQSDGTIELSIDPTDETKKLYTHHACTVAAIEII